MYTIGIIGTARLDQPYPHKPDALREASRVATETGNQVGVWFFDMLETIVEPRPDQADDPAIVTGGQDTSALPDNAEPKRGANLMVNGRVVARDITLGCERNAITVFFGDPRCRALSVCRAMEIEDYTVAQLLETFEVGYVQWLRVSGPRHGPDYVWEPFFVRQDSERCKRLDRTELVGVVAIPMMLAEQWLVLHGHWQAEQLKLF